MSGEIFVISDLHLGDRSGRDKFEAGDKTSPLRELLEHVGREDGELFILGDMFELWQMNLSALFIARRELLDQLAQLRVTYVPGNHDVDLVHFIEDDFLKHPFFQRMRAPFVREIGGKRFRFFHGHETDPFNAGDEPGFGRMLSIFGGVFEDAYGSPLVKGGGAVGDVLEQFGESMLTIWRVARMSMKKLPGKENVQPNAELTPAQNPDRLEEHVAGVRADREAGCYEVAVLGHTHQAGRIGEWYFNSGSWMGPRNPFLRISPDGHVTYFEWKGKRAVEHEMPVVIPDTKPEAPAVAARPFDTAISAARKLFPKPTKPERARWVLILQGAIALALGIATLTVSFGRGSAAGWRLLVTAFAAYALIDGMASLVSAPREQPAKTTLSRVRGVVSILLGLVVLRRGSTVEIFVVLVGFWAFLSGALRVAASLVFKGLVESKWLLVAGVGSMLAGLVFLLFPTTAPLVKYGLATYFCYYGVGELMAGIFGQRLPRVPGSFARAFVRERAAHGT
jgi:UDP-2,3-diacylglucosamine pyrophosphatase LpxH/uncharacterized membrane protein HdeD (DUF308 family)